VKGTNNLTKTQTSKQILDGYMLDLHKLGEEFQEAVGDDYAEDYYVFHIDRAMDRLETLAHLFMDLVPLLAGSKK
jgi:hypothetical protein